MRPDLRARQFAAAALFAGFGTLPLANAQLPNLGQITGAQTSTSGGDDSATTTGGNTQQTNTGRTTQTQTGRTSATTGTATGTSQTGSTATSSGTSPTLPAGVTATGTSFPSNPLSTKTTAGGTTFLGVITGSAPTLQGVGIPTLVVPYTANAPYMKKSSLPEGTVFIAIGAILAFMAFCVIGWRLLVAWSINRSVKRAAMASIMASETKNPGGWASNPFKPAGGFYTQAPGGSSLSLGDQLHKSEKTTRSTGNLRNPIPSTGSGLFFSPTASNVTQTTANIPMTGLPPQGNRSSTFLPAGYYASPSSTLGGTSNNTPNPPFASPTGGTGSGNNSPSLAARRMSSQRPLSNMQLAPPARETNRLSNGGRPVSGLNPQASTSSLQVGTGHGEDGVRAPSAYLEDLFEGGANPALGQQQHYSRR